MMLADLAKIKMSRAAFAGVIAHRLYTCDRRASRPSWVSGDEPSSVPLPRDVRPAWTWSVSSHAALARRTVGPLH